MFWAILITVVICSLVFIVYTEYQARRRAEQKCSQLRSENNNLRNRVEKYDQFEIKRLCHENYRIGKEDGSQCDMLYRSILNKYQAKDRVTIMMHGEPIGGNKREGRN